jgi:hypothetical protein
MGWQLIGEGLDKLVPMVDLQRMPARRDDSLHVGIDKILGHDELFPEDMQDPITADEAYEQDRAVRDNSDAGKLGVGPEHQGREVMLLDDFLWGLALEAAVPVVPVVEALKVLCLPLERRITREPLPPEELAVIGVVEVFHDPVPPRLADGDENRGDTVVEAHAQDDAHRAGMAVTAPEGQFVIELQERRDTHGLPAPQETLSHVQVFLGSLGLDVDPVAECVDDVERIKPPVALDIPGTDEIRLMEVVDGPGFRTVGIFDTLGNIGSFF